MNLYESIKNNLNEMGSFSSRMDTLRSANDRRTVYKNNVASQKMRKIDDLFSRLYEIQDDVGELGEIANTIGLDNLKRWGIRISSGPCICYEFSDPSLRNSDVYLDVYSDKITMSSFQSSAHELTPDKLKADLSDWDTTRFIKGATALLDIYPKYVEEVNKVIDDFDLKYPELQESTKLSEAGFSDFENDYIHEHKTFTGEELITWLIKLTDLEKFIKDSFQGIGVTFKYTTFEDEEPPYIDVCVKLDSKPSKENLDSFLEGFEDFCKTNKLDVNPIEGSYYDDTSAELNFCVLYGGDYFEFGDIADKSTSTESKSVSSIDELIDFVRYSSFDADFVEESSSNFGTKLTFDIPGDFDSNRTVSEDKLLFKEVESFYKELVDFLKLHNFDAKATYLADDPSMPDMFVIEVRDGGNYFDLTFDGNNFSKKSKYSTK